MAVKKLYLDKKVLIANKPQGGGQPNSGVPGISLLNLENYVDLKEYISSVSVPYTLPLTIAVDTITEATSGNTVSFPDDIKTDVIAEVTSATGVTIDGVLLKDSVVNTNQVAPLSGNALTLNNLLVYNGNPINITRTPVAHNVTTTITAADIYNGYITSTSVASVTLTLPSTGAVSNFFGSFSKATFEFTVDNLTGANTVTIDLPSGWSVITPVITGQDDLGVDAGELGVFRVISISNAVCKIIRVV